MSDIKNKIAAQIIKAEMMGDQEKVRQLRMEMSNPSKHNRQREPEPHKDLSADSYRPTQGHSIWDTINEPSRRASSNLSGRSKDLTKNYKVQNFLKSTGSLSQMFAPAKRTTTSDEVKMYLKTAGKLSREDLETKQFSEEIDDSQKILDRGKKRNREPDHEKDPKAKRDDTRRPSSVEATCIRCADRLPKHLIIDRSRSVFISLDDAKPFLSSMSNVIISNTDHESGNSFVAAGHRVQDSTESMIDSIREMWRSKGYKCIIMETYLRNNRPVKGGLISCGAHFQVHCLPIKEKHFERARMSFKQALQDCESEWSMNRKLISTGGRRIQSYLPKGLSYFWVCFDKLTNGFGHVIEQDGNFSQYFGLEVLSSLLDKDFNPMRLQQREKFEDQFDRSRDFKILYAQYKE